MLILKPNYLKMVLLNSLLIITKNTFLSVRL